MVEALSGERYDRSSDPLIPNLGWVTVNGFVRVVLGPFPFGFGDQKFSFCPSVFVNTVKEFLGNVCVCVHCGIHFSRSKSKYCYL